MRLGHVSLQCTVFGRDDVQQTLLAERARLARVIIQGARIVLHIYFYLFVNR